MYSAGDVVLAQIQFVDSYELKKRPAVILFEEFDNIVVAGITSNTTMQGVPLTRKEGAIVESVIKTNYIFTVSRMMIEKKVFSLTKRKRKMVFNTLVKQLEVLDQ